MGVASPTHCISIDGCPEGTSLSARHLPRPLQTESDILQDLVLQCRQLARKLLKREKEREEEE